MKHSITYRPEIDGLRAIAVLSVILFHAGFTWVSGGFVGVDVFFVISGYLITTIILRQLDAGSFSIADFYERRARRILPALFLVLLSCMPAAYVLLLPDQLSGFFKSMISVILFVSNIYFRNEVNYFARTSEEEPLLHTWSLAVEEQYYLLFPLLAILLWRKGRKMFLLMTIAIGIASFLYADLNSMLRPDKAFFDTRGRVWELFLGSITAIYLLRRRTPTLPSQWFSEAGSALGVGLILWACWQFEQGTPFPGRYALVPTLGTVLIILFASPSTMVGRLLATRIAVGIGLISYSAYLWHQPLFAFARIVSRAHPSELVFAVLSLASLGLAYLSWRYVEQPFRNKQKHTRVRIFTFSGAGVALLLMIAISGYALKGLPERFASSDADLLVPYKDRGEYVRQRHSALREFKSFNASDTLKILVIGDSYSQDLINVLHEGALLGDAEFRVIEVPRRCQIYRGHKPVENFIEPRFRELCSQDHYKELTSLLEDADAIFIAASWQGWSAERLPETLDRLGISQDDNYLVFGRKSLGYINRPAYVGLGAKEKALIRNPISPRHVEINSAMQRNIKPRHFVDLHALLCGPDELTCPIFDNNGKLLSYDGSHLTEAGARYLAKRLSEESVFMQFINSMR